MISSNSSFDETGIPSELISPIDYQTNSSITNSKDQGLKFDNEISYCSACQRPILDRVVLKVGSSTWHVRCLRCVDCGVPLIDKCYSKNNEIYCKDDFFRRYGTRCAACDEVIPPSEVIRKAQNHIYHLECFACISCHRQLNTGEEFFLLPSKKLMCRPDFEVAKAKEQELDQGNKRPRTTITAKQLEALKKTYSESSKPARHVREQLSAKTGLDMRVVQVWFQNRRAKEKRMKKDANRGCWHTPYFSNSNSGGKVSSAKGDSDEQSDDQTNEPLDVSYQSDIESDSEAFNSYGSQSSRTNNSATLANNDDDSNANPTSKTSNSHSNNVCNSIAQITNNHETPTNLTNPVSHIPCETYPRHLEILPDSRAFPPIGLRDWINLDQAGLFSPNPNITPSNGQTNLIPGFHMVTGSFSTMGLLQPILPDTNSRITDGFPHGIESKKTI